jgi:hypothetical protein
MVLTISIETAEKIVEQITDIDNRSPLIRLAFAMPVQDLMILLVELTSFVKPLNNRMIAI